MKNGKILPAVLDRSVLRTLKLAEAGGNALGHGCDGAETACGGAETACGGVETASGGAETASSGVETASGTGWLTACAAGPVGGPFDLTPEMIVTGALNNLAAAGASGTGLQTVILLPEEAEEAVLKEIMRSLAALAAAKGLKILGGDTTVSDAVSRPVLSVTAWGLKETREKDAGRGIMSHGKDCGGESASGYSGGEAAVVMTGWAGQAGTAVITAAHETELRKRFPASLVEAALSMGRDSGCIEAARYGRQSGALLQHDISRGGVFAALWELSERLAAVNRGGIEIDLKAIPIRQETIEICEQYELNPYQLFGQGALLTVTENPAALLKSLHARGIPASVIGHTAAGRGCRIDNGEERRYLEKSQQDVLWQHAKNVALSNVK